MKELVAGRPEFVELWHKICDEAENSNRAWIKMLRDKGFKAAHPNDGWVDREKNTLILCYPHFDDGVKSGDLVMLGWHFDSSDKWRPVRVTEKTNFGLLGSERWSFEDA